MNLVNCRCNLILILLLLLAGCSDSGEGVTAAPDDATSSAFPAGVTSDKRIVQDRSGSNSSVASTARDSALISRLPPDPGEAGMATLEGIDSDGDGVRDDVQRWIALTFPNSEKVRAALTQSAITIQKFMLDADADQRTIYQDALRMDRDISCLAYITQDFSDIGEALKANELNTYLRSKAWLKADSAMSGAMVPGLPFNQWKQGCDFDPDQFPN